MEEFRSCREHRAYQYQNRVDEEPRRQENPGRREHSCPWPRHLNRYARVRSGVFDIGGCLADGAYIGYAATAS